MVAEKFLSALFSKLDDLFVIYTLPARRSFFYHGSDFAIAADDIGRFGARQNIYCGVAVQPTGLSDRQRGKNDTVKGMVGLFADIDIKGEHHDKKNYPPTIHSAMELLSDIGHQPSVLLNTGGGIQSWWLFHEPWIFASNDERDEGAALLKTWISSIQKLAAKKSWAVDSVCDLARVMRVPGTINLKSMSNVELIGIADVRYDRKDLIIAEAEEPKKKSEEKKQGPAAHAWDLARTNAKFKRTWNRKRFDLSDQSASSYDLAIANAGAIEGWTDHQIIAALTAWRMRHGEDTDKINRADYVARTIKKAREDNHDERQKRVVNESIKTNPADGRDATLQKLSALVGKTVTRFVCIKGERPFYWIEIDGEKINLGGSSTAFFRDPFGLKLIENRIILPYIKPKDWIKVRALLVAAQDDEEIEQDSETGKIDEWLAGYFYDVAIAPDEEWRESAAGRQPFKRDGKVYLYRDRLHSWIVDIAKDRISKAELSRYLRAAGFAPRKVWIGDKETHTPVVSYWEIPQDDFAPHPSREESSV